MKKAVIVILLFFGLNLHSQDSTAINSGFVKAEGVFLRLDSLNRPLFRDDSLILNIFLVFNHNLNEITSISIKAGDIQDANNGFSTVLNISNVNGKYFISGNGITNHQLHYGSNLILDVKCGRNENFKWATIYYQKGPGIQSSKKYFKISG